MLYSTCAICNRPILFLAYRKQNMSIVPGICQLEMRKPYLTVCPVQDQLLMTTIARS